MNKTWLEQLQSQLDQLQGDGLLRTLKPVTAQGPRVRMPDGRELINLASNDYLALAQHPHLRAAAIASINQNGVGGGASRLVSGHSETHQSTEKRFAQFKHAQAALFCPTGYMANLAVLTSLVEKGDLLCIDKLTHASLIDAAKASDAQMRIFPHLGYDKLERLLSRDDSPRKFIVTDSIFSMDGDGADLPVLCELARKYNAILIVDEAHGTGMLGQTGSGLCEAAGVSDWPMIVISTASKAMGSLGGMITGPQVVIDTLINKARPFIYTTATAPFQPALINAALDVIENEPWRRTHVLELARELRTALGLTTDPVVSAIVPLIAGSAQAAIALSERLLDAGFYAPAIRPPTVAPGTARVRISLRADLTQEHLSSLIRVIK